MGERILNRFVLRERIGSGGFGTVYRAWDERLEREVAVKVFDGPGAADPRVLREAQAAARLNHSGIVTLYELGRDSSRSYLVSELVDGDTLALLNRDGVLSDRDVAELGIEICEALAHAHARGVVHRDVKPQNLLVAARTGRAKVMDFGIARVLGGDPLTAAGDVIGTIAYMAPEQAEGDIAGPDADTYSLALTLYECWAGRQPIARDTPAATARAVGKGAPPLGELRPDLPEALTHAIDACLRPAPHERPGLEDLVQSMEEALPALSREPLGPVEGRSLPTGPARLLHHPALPGALGAVSTGGLVVMAMAYVGAPGWAFALALAAGALAIVAPRTAWVASASGLVAWLAATGRPGAALVVAALTAPQAILLPFAGRMWALPAAAPLLGLMGMAPVYAALAGLSSSLPRRIVLGALGYMWLVVAEATWRTTLLFGVPSDAAGGWAERSGVAASDVLAPLLSRPVVLGAIVWGIAAACLAPLLRGRVVPLELLGVLVWAAGLLSVQRLLSEWGDAPAPPAGGLAAGVLVLVAAALLYRSGRPRTPGLVDVGAPGGALRSDGAGLRLP